MYFVNNTRNKSIKSPEFDQPSFGERIFIKVGAVLAAGTFLWAGHSCYADYQDEAIRRNPPAGSTCTIINDLSDLGKADDIWFEGAEDIILGGENIYTVVRRNVDPTESITEQLGEVQMDYAICDYPGPSYADGGRRSVVNPDNLDETAVTIVPRSEFPESPTVS